MNDLILIGLLGVFAYHAMAIGKNFKGASASAKFYLEAIGSIGYLIHMVAIIWAFWPYAWWQPIITFMATVILGGVTAPIFQRSIIGTIITCLGAVALGIITISIMASYFIN